MTLAKIVLNLARISFIFLAILSFQSGCSSTSDEVVIADRTLISDYDFACDSKGEEFRDKLQQLLADLNGDTRYALAQADICGAFSEGGPDDLIEYSLDSGLSAPHGVFLVGRKTPTDEVYYRNFWLFAFLDDKEVTDKVFGQNNLVELENGVLHSIPFTLPEPLEKSSMLTFLLVDSYYAEHKGDGKNYIFYRAFLKIPGSEFPPAFDAITAEPGVVDPYPEVIAVDPPGLAPFDMQRMVTVTSEEYHQEVAFFPLDLVNGKRAPIECDGRADGWTIIRPMYKEGSSITCIFPEGFAPTQTPVFVLHDQFSVDPETGRQHIVLFLDKRLSYFGF